MLENLKHCNNVPVKERLQRYNIAIGEISSAIKVLKQSYEGQNYHLKAFIDLDFDELLKGDSTCFDSLVPAVLGLLDLIDEIFLFNSI